MYFQLFSIDLNFGWSSFLVVGVKNQVSYSSARIRLEFSLTHFNWNLVKKWTVFQERYIINQQWKKFYRKHVQRFFGLSVKDCKICVYWIKLIFKIDSTMFSLPLIKCLLSPGAVSSSRDIKIGTARLGVGTGFSFNFSFSLVSTWYIWEY